MTGVGQTVRNLWLAATGRKQPAAPEVVLFDSAEPVRDLDDPFYDYNVQMRVAEKIAATGNRKTKNSY
jgi:hypothetical protein